MLRRYYYEAQPYAASTSVPTSALQGWWRADAGLTLSAAGTVAHWQDQSGQGHHLTPDPVAPPPTTALWAGTTAVSFDSSQALAPVVLDNPAPAVYTVALALQQAPVMTEMMAFMFGQERGAAQALATGFNVLALNTFRGEGYGIGAGPAVMGRPVLITVELRSNATTACRLWVNGQEQVLSLLVGGLYNVPLDAYFRLGGAVNTSGGAYFWHGWIGEALVYDRALDDPERAQLHAYLSDRFQIPLWAGPAERFGNASFEDALSYGFGTLAAQPRWQVGNGVATIAGGQGVNGQDFLYQRVPLEPGASYRVAVEVVSYTSGSLGLVTQSGAINHDFGPLSAGTFEFTFAFNPSPPEATGDWFTFVGRDDAVFSLGSVSLKRLA